MLLAGAGAWAQGQTAPERRVQGNTITSARSPGIGIELPKEARYLGAERWDLYGVADCELHVWVEADRERVVKRLYWVQFEAFLPGKPEARYKYPFTRTEEIGGFTFDVRARFGGKEDTAKPESDAGHVRGMVKAAGYQLPQDTMNVRLVHLPDEQKRTELMIIYLEDLQMAGVKAEDLMPGGKAEPRWPALEKRLIERAKSKIRVSRR